MDIGAAFCICFICPGQYSIIDSYTWIWRLFLLLIFIQQQHSAIKEMCPRIYGNGFSFTSMQTAYSIIEKARATLLCYPQFLLAQLAQTASCKRPCLNDQMRNLRRIGYLFTSFFQKSQFAEMCHKQRLHREISIFPLYTGAFAEKEAGKDPGLFGEGNGCCH